MENQIRTDRTLVGVARFVSVLFTPLVVPTGAFLVLFLFSYFRIMPPVYKLIVIGLVFCFTFAMPAFTIRLFCWIHKLPTHELNDRRKRYMPYLLTIISYAFCLLMMFRLNQLSMLNIPWYMSGIILASLLIMIIFMLVNLKWKLSEHMAGVGGVIGGLVSFSALFGYNPVSWLCFFILVAGVLGSARIILGHHKLGEIIFGFAIGLVCSLLVLHPAINIFFRFILL